MVLQKLWRMMFLFLFEFVGLILHSLWQLTSVDMLKNIILVVLRRHKIKLEIAGHEAKNLVENTLSACCGNINVFQTLTAPKNSTVRILGVARF